MNHFVSSLFIIVLIGYFSIYGVNAADKRIRLESVQTLTLRKGLLTAARRTSPLQQLQCVGGAARLEHQPDAVQCTNKGLNDLGEIQWKCEAEMDSRLKFGRLEVNCEGYDYPEDSYVLAGSCGLEYELEYASNQQRHSPQPKQTNYNQYNQYKTKTQSGGQSWSTIFVVLMCIGGVFLCLVVCAKGNNPNQYQRPTRRSGYAPSSASRAESGSGPAASEYGGSTTNSGDFYPTAPSYESFTQQQQPTYTSTDSTTRSEPGFWTGAATGAAVGYAAGSYMSGSSAQRASTGDYEGSGYSTNNSSSNNTTSSFTSSTTDASDTTTRTGFATTKRR